MALKELLKKSIDKSKVEENAPIFRNLIKSLVKKEVEGFKTEILQELNRILQEKIKQEGITLVEGPTGHTPVKGIDFFTKAEVEAIKKDLIPKKGKDFFDGKHGRTPKKGIDFVDGKKGDPGISVSAEDVLRALEKKKIKQGNIEGLEQTISSLRNALRLGGGGGGGGTLQQMTITGTVNGTNDTFVMDREYSARMIFWNGQLQEEDTHYTISGATITFSAGHIPTAGTVHGMGQPG